MLTLLGLPDDYSHDGRALFELADTNALPVALRGHTAALTTLASVFKQLNACVGQFGAATITVSSKAINSTSPGDVRYQLTETALAQLGTQRDAVTTQTLALLEGAEFHNTKLNEPQIATLTIQAQTGSHTVSLGAKKVGQRASTVRLRVVEASSTRPGRLGQRAAVTSRLEPTDGAGFTEPRVE